MPLTGANFRIGRYGGMCPQFHLAFSLEEAPTFGRSFFTVQGFVRNAMMDMIDGVAPMFGPAQ
jgi:hypothetical protein